MKSLFLLLLFFSCSTPEQLSKSRATLLAVQSTSEVQKYLLPQLPFWANFSSHGQCRRNESIRYMNFSNLKKSYGFDYLQAVHLQNMFNKKMFSYKASIGSDEYTTLSNFKDESFIFYNAYEQVIAGSFDFKIPAFKKVSVVWIDSILGNENKVKQVLKREDVLGGFPIILSQCLTYFELEKLISNLDLDHLGAQLVSAEMFNTFNKKLESIYRFELDLQEVLPGKEVYLFGELPPTNILGIKKYIKL